MKHEIYIISNGKLFCDSGTIGFVDIEGNKRNYPIRNISDIYCMGSVSLTSGIIKRVLMNELNIHFLSKYGTYRGSLSYSSILDGKVIRNQILSSLDQIKRTEIAREILISLKQAMKYLLIRYEKKGYLVRAYIDALNTIRYDYIKNVEELRGHEAVMWKLFYEGIRNIIKKFEFTKREYHPPKGEINAMISFGNMLLYSEVFSIIKEVGLLPEIGFLHESNEKRYTLAIDISEMFKPVLVFSTIIYLTNKKLINERDFVNEAGYTFLNEEGKYTFIMEFNKRLNKTYYIKQLKRGTTIRFLIKRECQKLKESLKDNKKYESYKKWYECL